MKLSIKQPSLAAVLFFGSLISAAAAEPGNSHTLTSPDQVPEGLSASDWNAIRATYAAAVTRQQAYVKASNTGALDNFGAAVAVSGDTVVVGAHHEASASVGVNGNQASNSASNSGAVYVFVRSSGVWSQQAYLKASNTGSDDGFGSAVSISGDTIVVGAPYEASNGVGVNGNQVDNSSLYSGAAYVFVRSSGNWSQQAYLKASNSGTYDFFGSGVAVSGDTIVIGAPGESSNAVGVNASGQADNSSNASGASYVFVRNGSAWTQQAYLKASNTGEQDHFGVDVDISGDTLVVGAFYESSSAVGVNGNQADNSASDSGASYVFVRSSGIWSQQAYLKASNTGAYDHFGAPVAVSGNTIVVGASYEDGNGVGVNSNAQADNSASSSGAAYVFVRSGSVWSQQAYLKASNSDPDDYFGTSVSVSGERIVVGAFYESSKAVGVNGNQADNSAYASGAAYVFARSSGMWTQQQYLKAGNTESSDRFGGSAAISGDTIVVGAYGESGNSKGVNSSPTATGTADQSGAAYIFGPKIGDPPVEVTYKIKASVNDRKLGSVKGAGTFKAGKTVKLTAKPKKDHKFLGWYEKKKLIGKNKVLIFKNLKMNHTVTAKFK